MAPPPSLRVLVVGERAEERAALRQRLCHQGSAGSTAVLEASDGWSALTALNVHPIDVVLLDLGDWSEREARTLRDLRQAAPDVPVVVVSDAEHESGAFSAVQSGAQDYVIKELDDTRVIRRALRHAVERAASARRRDTLLIREHDARLAAEEAREDANRVRARAEILERRASFLADASAAASATLDARAVLAASARLIVPHLGSAAAVFMTRDDGTLQLVEALDDGSSSAKRAVGAATRVVTHESLAQVLSRAQQRGYVVLDDVSDITDHPAAQAVPEAETNGDGWHYCVAIPLRTPKRTYGLLLLITRNGKRVADVTDPELLQTFAARVSSALDHACLYEAAQRAVRTRDQVLGIVSHDLRNPLSAIGICATALRGQDAMVDAERRQLAATISEAVAWTQRLLGDLLDVASIEGGHLSIATRELDPIVVLAKSLDLFEHGTSGAAVRLGPGIAESLPKVTGDEQRILQVIANLIANARKFTPTDGSITLGAEPAPGVVRFWVADSGAGIAPEDQKHVFDWFWRASHERAQRGTGLGLAIARGIVEAHGGAISVESSPGRGATFSFTIPLARSVVAAIDAPSALRVSSERVVSAV